MHAGSVTDILLIPRMIYPAQISVKTGHSYCPAALGTGKEWHKIHQASHKRRQALSCPARTCAVGSQALKSVIRVRITLYSALVGVRTLQTAVPMTSSFNLPSGL
jgi:hypothetical protein